MLRFLANEQWGSILTGTVSMLLMIFAPEMGRYPQAVMVLLLMVAIAIVSGVARGILADKGGADLAVARLAETLGVDRQLIGRGNQKPIDQQTYQRWQTEHSAVYVGLCEPKIVKGRIQYANELTLFRARLSEVLQWAKEKDFKFFSYNHGMDMQELMLWKDGKKRPPDSSALYLHAPTGSILIIGSTPEEVFNFKPHEDLMPDWKRVYAFGQWRVEHDAENKVVIHDEITPIPETEKNAPIADAYDPSVRGRGAFKKGVSYAPSVVEERRPRVEYVK